MAIRYGNRPERIFFPPSIEECVSQDAPVRAYDAFINALDLRELGIYVDPLQAGCPSYDPRAMLKLLVYGTSYGFRSSRKLERATHNDLTFIWLMGGLKPDHKTIAEFRRNNSGALKEALKMCVYICVKLGLIAGNVIFLDGSKFRANASIGKCWTREKIERESEKIDKRIEELLDSSERLDCDEEGLQSEVKIDEKLVKSGKMKEKIGIALEEIAKVEKKRKGRPSRPAREKRHKPTTNITDSECVKGKGRQGTHAVYNAQVVTDDENGLIVSAEAVSEENDLAQFAVQIDNANKNMGKKCGTAVADAGYSNVDELDKTESQAIKVIVPSPSQSSRKKPGEFDKKKFEYDKAKDVYICPVGSELKLLHVNKDGSKVYYAGKGCLKCVHYGICTKNKKGRTVLRHRKEERLVHFESEYSKLENQEIYKRRKERAELPFGHFKRNLHAGYFLLRGRNGADAELSINAICFNLCRAITLLGVPGLIAKLAET